MADAIDKFGWLDQALCAAPGVDPDMFFDVLRRPEAIAMCKRCPVEAQCDQRAEENDAYRGGVWAGRTRSRTHPGPSTTTEYLAPHEQHRHSRHTKPA